MRQEFFISSSEVPIHCCKWIPTGKPIGILQIIHGIKEYVARYEDMASYFCRKGYLVVGADHPGHGESVPDGMPQGYLYGGWKAAVRNIYCLYKQMRREYADIPYIMFGHSMGSFLTTTYLMTTPSAPDAAIISGTGWLPASVLSAGLAVSKAEAKRLGACAASPLLEKLMFGSYNAKIVRPKTTFDWLTTDERIVDTYMRDPMCNWTASIQLCDQMLSAMRRNRCRENLDKISRDIPMFFLAGQQDPVGNYGNGVLKAVQAFKNAGIRDITVELYPNMRHECHNEIGKEKVFDDISQWIESRLFQ